jgi:Zn-dependent metalloprotease
MGSPDLRQDARAAVEQFRREQPQASVQIDPGTGLVRSLANLRHPQSAAPSAGVDGAAEFLARHARMLLGKRGVEELQLSHVDTLPTSSHVRYQQIYRGLPVWGARLSVHLDAQGQVRMLQSSIRPEIETDTRPALTAADALRAAQGAIPRASVWGKPQVALGVLPRADGARLAYRVEFATRQPADWRFFIDAQSGAILSRMSLLRRAEADAGADRSAPLPGEGLVVDENPYTTPELVHRPFRYLDGSGILKGAFADVWSVRTDGCAMQDVRLSQAADDRFTAGPGDPRFDEQMLYYHVTRAHDYFRSSFGFTGRDHPLRVVAHVPELDGNGCPAGGMDQAMYSPSADALFFGDGTGYANGGHHPYSRDADVIDHEYTHAVVDRIVGNLSGEVNYNIFGQALEEGYADYFACTINNDPDMGEYTAALIRGMRCLENSHRYPDDVIYPTFHGPEPHWTGMIWGGACWDLRKALGAAVADQLVFHSIYYQSDDGSADLQTGAMGVLQADQELYGGEHQAVIRQVMQRRGLL